MSAWILGRLSMKSVIHSFIPGHVAQVVLFLAGMVRPDEMISCIINTEQRGDGAALSIGLYLLSFCGFALQMVLCSFFLLLLFRKDTFPKEKWKNLCIMKSI